jgi:hypothetical protein
MRGFNQLFVEDHTPVSVNEHDDPSQLQLHSVVLNLDIAFLEPHRLLNVNAQVYGSNLVPAKLHRGQIKLEAVSAE